MRPVLREGDYHRQALVADKSLSHHFQLFLLTRIIVMQGDLIDHHFNSSEKRLASGSSASKAQNGSKTAALLPGIACPRSTAERWASYVLGACKSARDPRTIGIWAREVAVSYTTLCESCRLIGIQPRYARDFTRILRIILISAFDFSKCFSEWTVSPCSLAGLLDIGDKRTLDSILQKAGFGAQTANCGHVSVAYFLDNQRFIARENPGLNVIREVVAAA
jgi:hypothetical protein